MIITPANSVEEVTGAAAAVDGVAQVVPVTDAGPGSAGAPGAAPAGGRAQPRVVDGLVQLNATLEDAADSDAAIATVGQLRQAVRGADPRGLVGGATATDLDTRRLRALAVTGGVITSAGLVLAATFGALVVLPLLILTQAAFIVAFGVLLDTLVVRSLVVPAAVHLLGDRVWWPSRLTRRRPAGGPPIPPAAAAWPDHAQTASRPSPSRRGMLKRPG